jgi:hypothetical protein
VEDAPYLDFDALQQLAQHTDHVTADCACATDALLGWASLPISFPEPQLKKIGTLVASAYEEATFQEYDPDSVGFWSPDAPVAPLYYPANRCDVWACTVCSRAFLRYVEGGGYFVDPRIRRLTGRVLVDARLG